VAHLEKEIALTAGALEVVGSTRWTEICKDLQQRLFRLHSIRFFTGCCDADLLLRHVPSRIVCVHIQSASTSYERTFESLVGCRRLRKVQISNGAPISNECAQQLLVDILARLDMLLLCKNTAFTTYYSWWKLFKLAENHSVATITCDAVTGDLQAYMKWNAALNGLRLQMLDRCASQHRLKRSHNDCGVAGTVEAAVRVLKVWYRSTHRPVLPTSEDKCNRHQRDQVDPKQDALASVSSCCVLSTFDNLKGILYKLRTGSGNDSIVWCCGLVA
jgi:hypothetical protein